MNSGSDTARFLWHPLIVHFPIAFLMLECVLLILWILKKDDFFRRSGYLVFRLGYCTMLLAMIAGYWDANGINSVVRKHFVSAVLTAIFYAGRGLLWLRKNITTETHAVILVTSAIFGCLFLAVTAFLGGLLVYS